jgi:predicted Zn finger-like uncharacterized protein
VNLYTRCPACLTVFRVTTRELQASNGRVRCGHCQEVFDAFATLSAQEPAKESVPAPAQTAVQSPSAVGDEQATAPASMAAGAARAASSSPPRVARPDPAVSLYEWEFRLPPQRRRTALWVSASILLLALAGIQASIAFRDRLLASLPLLRPAYERACDWFGCEVGLPRLSDYLHVDSTSLQVVDPSRPNQMELTVLLRNRAAVAVQYPAFELTLTDARDQAIARRVFLPGEYLSSAKDRQAGLEAGAEVPIRLYLDTGKIAAAGYRVYFFYP